MGGLSDCGCHTIVSLATDDPIRDGPKVSPNPCGLDLPKTGVVGWESVGGSH